MCNNFLASKYAPSHQRGISLILVLFLLVVVSLLAVSMAQLNRGGSDAVSMEIQSTRALFAAESGAHMAAMQIFPIGGTPSCPNSNPINLPQRTFNTPGLNNCAANVTHRCANVAGRIVFTVESSGTCGTLGNADYARRKITVGLWSL